jgi:hypothetical protein
VPLPLKQFNKPFLIPYDEVGGALEGFFQLTVDLEGPCDGTRDRRQRLYAHSSKLIHMFVQGTSLLASPAQDGWALERSETIITQVEFLKDMIWCYVINNPALAGHQHGATGGYPHLVQSDGQRMCEIRILHATGCFPRSRRGTRKAA